MATGNPTNIVLPKNLSIQPTSNTVTSNTINIPDESKYHVVVGIAMMNVLVPELKKYIDLKMEAFYDFLHRKKYKSILWTTICILKRQAIHLNTEKYRKMTQRAL